ncbi:MAG: hypothetical protein GX621_15910 [Pirellulaceae bacterium]|mgnify:CR=1 FL=1|nr:hypothetical protein [Pirellulaceae bacterium]
MHIRRREPAWVLAVLLAALTAAGGCGQPQVGRENLELLASLRTALSAQNVEWLDKNAAIIETRRDEGQLSQETHARLAAMVEKARAGQWKEAERELVAFQKAQRPPAR